MALFEKLHDKTISDKEFINTAVLTFAQITGSAVNHKTRIMFSRLLKLYGRKGIISALYTLDTAVMSENFSLNGNPYPFLVYGAKKAFETTDTSSQNLTDLVNKLRRKNVA